MKVLTVEMRDGSVWCVPVDVIARNRAEYYAHEFGGDVTRSMVEDTMLLFDSDDYEVEEWAVIFMKWRDVESQAKVLQGAPQVDFQEGWMNGEKSVIELIDS